MYELLLEFDLIDTEDFRVAKERKDLCTLSFKAGVATRELPSKRSCRDILTPRGNSCFHNQGMACPAKGLECCDKKFHVAIKEEFFLAGNFKVCPNVK